MSMHTPGPWEIEYDDTTEYWHVRWHNGFADVGGVNHHANARLIAAAPEMAKTIEQLASALDEMVSASDYAIPRHILDVLNKAIAKDGLNQGGRLC